MAHGQGFFPKLGEFAFRRDGRLSGLRVCNSLWPLLAFGKLHLPLHLPFHFQNLRPHVFGVSFFVEELRVARELDQRQVLFQAYRDFDDIQLHLLGGILCLRILDPVQGRLEKLGVLIDLLLAVFSHLPVDLVPALSICRLVGLLVPVRNVSLDEFSPNFGIWATNLRRSLFDVPLETNCQLSGHVLWPMTLAHQLFGIL